MFLRGSRGHGRVRVRVLGGCIEGAIEVQSIEAKLFLNHGHWLVPQLIQKFEECSLELLLEAV